MARGSFPVRKLQEELVEEIFKAGLQHQEAMLNKENIVCESSLWSILCACMLMDAGYVFVQISTFYCHVPHLLQSYR